jgi:hypothetical protein
MNLPGESPLLLRQLVAIDTHDGRPEDHFMSQCQISLGATGRGIVKQ